ncbi:MAG: MBG domain-containing protein [Bacteroidota bacterium]
MNYSLNFFPGTLSVTKAPLTAKAEDKTRVYGAANLPNKILYTGFVNGDIETAVNIPPTINGPAATPASNVDVYPITLSGGFATNYDLTLQNGALTITKATLTARADNQSRAYGQTNPQFTTSYSGFVVGDDATDITEPVGSTAATPTSNAGTYPITLAGGAATNYSFVYQGGTLTVTKAILNANANDATRNYGQANPTPFGVTYAGFLNGDDVGDITPPTASTLATPTSNVGNYTISLTGGSAPNYTLALASGTLTVSKATLTAKVDNKTRLYGASNPPNSITYTGFLNGDDAGDLITPPSFVGPFPNASSPVDDYTISLSGGSATNYSIIPQAGTLTINQAPLTAKADDKSRTYGATNPVLTITYTGFVNGENATNITVPTGSTTAIATSNVGPYPITLSGTTGNYAFNFVGGTLTVNKATATVTADNKVRTYGATNPTFSLTYSGLMNGENSSVIDVLPNGATTATGTTSVQNVPITVSGGSDNNYAFTYISGVLTITKTPLTATADDKSRPYGSANPANTITYTGFKNGETATVITQPTSNTSANTASPVGTYSIGLTGGSATNYQLTLTGGTLTVGKAVITVTAANQSKTYGAPNPSLTVSYSGFVNSQSVADIDQLPTVSTDANLVTSVATYDINASSATDANYSFSYVPGVLTITKASLTATAENKTTTYGTIPPLTIAYTGLMNGETDSVIDQQSTITTSATVTSDIGTYDIELSGGADNNYDITNVNGTLTLNKAPLTVAADNKSKIIGFVNPPLTATYSGFMNNDSQDVIDVLPTLTTTAAISSGPGDYSIVVAGGADDHYEFVFQQGTLSVILNTPPVVNSFNMEISEDTSLPLTLQLFINNYSDEPGGTISNVKIVSLPANGVLFKAGLERVFAGEELPVTGGQLGELSYLPNKDYAGNDSFSWNVFDGTFTAANNATITIKIKAVNDPPVLSNIESTNLLYNPGDAPVKITEGIIVNDIDDDFAFSATITIDQETFSSGDKLAVTIPSGSKLKLTYNENTGELILNGKDTRTNYQALLRDITFSSPVNGDAVIGDKVVNIFVNDSLASSNIVSRTISISQVFPELDIVNAFTPNGDGVNDAWDFLNLQSYSTISINVYDMNGNKVFNCTTDDCAWDGTFKGKALPAGPYAYTIDLDHKKRTYNGIVTILK